MSENINPEKYAASLEVLSEEALQRLDAHPKYEATRALLKDFGALVDTSKLSEVEAIEEALKLSIVLHIDQADRPDGTQYIEHPLSVAVMLLKYSVAPTQEELVSALLHDSVEDQEAKLVSLVGAGVTDGSSALEKLFGAKVADTVSLLTHTGKDYAEEVKKVFTTEESLRVKFCDFSQNTTGYDKLPSDEVRNHFYKKYAPVAEMFLSELEKSPRGFTEEFRQESIKNLKEFISNAGSS